MTPKTFALAAAGLFTLLCGIAPAFAQSAPPLGAVASFGVLGGSAVTAAGPAGTTVGGDVGSAPTPTVTGFPPAVVTAGFTVYTAANAVTTQARSDAGIAYNNLAAQTCTVAVPADLSLLPQPLAPGVYCMGAGGLTGTITLSGSASSVWVFKTASSLTTAGASNIVMAGGATSCNVFWQVGSAATLGASSTFRGNLFAGTAITMGTSVNWVGRAIAGTENVTMAGTDTIGGCSTPAPPPPPPVCPTITLSPPTLPGGTVGVAYSQTIAGSGGTPPYTFTITGGALPAGLTLTPAGVVSGTPTTAGNASVTIRGMDANGCFATVTYVIAIAAAPPPPPVCPAITLSPPTLPPGSLGVAYSQTIVGSGGTAPYFFGVTSGVLPAGLTLTSAGVLSGTPTAAGTFNVTIRGTDAAGCFAERVYTISIADTLPPPPGCPVITLPGITPPPGTVGVAYLQTITASGGTAPYVFGVTAGALPTGLTLTPGGVLSGTPTVGGTYAFQIRATDANGCFASLGYALVVAVIPAPTVCPTVVLTPPTLPNGAVGIPYSQVINGNGGNPPYVFGVVAGALPPGLILTPGGLLTGTPTTAGTSSFVIRGTDANGCFAELPYTMTIATPVPTLPQAFGFLLALGLTGLGYLRLRRRARAD